MTLPPPRRAVQALVEWLFAVINALSVLSFLHFGLLAADQSQRETSSSDPAEAALAEGKALRKAGRLNEAITAYERALKLARERNSADQIVRSLLLISAARLFSFDYRAALAAAQEALETARPAGLYTLAGGASGTIASIYTQLGDFRSAEEEGNRAIGLLKQAPPASPQTRNFLARALETQAQLHFLQGETEVGKTLSNESIGIAQQIGDTALQASAWDLRGIAILRHGELREAQQSLSQAFALRQTLHDKDGLAICKEHLAELELTKASPDYAAALGWIDEALATGGVVFKTVSEFYPLHIRGKILLAMGNETAALKEFQRAVKGAEQWRQGALPGDSTNTQTVLLLHDVYHDFAHLAARVALKTNDEALKTEALEALAANRAASLREQVRLALAQRGGPAPQYFQKLAELGSAQARVTFGENTKAERTHVLKIRAELSSFENQSYLKDGKNFISSEKNLRKNSLRDIQLRLGKSKLLLSFSLAEEKSYLWAVSGDEVELYELPGRKQIEEEAAQMTKAVRNGGDYRSKGAKLSQTLFGALQPHLAKRPEWLIVGDGGLLDGVPYAALNGEHTWRLLPSELLLCAPAQKTAAGRFLGIADPVYNEADVRFVRAAGRDDARAENAGVFLARLAGSEKEVRTSARQSGLPDPEVLAGTHASGEELRRVLANAPGLLHFAVHIVSPLGRGEEAALALSLKDGAPELLTPEAIATYRLPGSLVVLSGCSSIQGKAVPSAGLLGLSRAWLLAGAAAVLVSSWPTPDDSGRFFLLFTAICKWQRLVRLAIGRRWR